MVFSFPDIEQKVLSSLNERTLVGGRAVTTSPIAKELGISRAQLTEALLNLARRGWISIGPGEDAVMTPEGHLHVG